MLSTDQRDPSSWHSQFVTAGGGELMHNGTHLTDLIRFYAGDPEWVFATVERGNKAITIETWRAACSAWTAAASSSSSRADGGRYGTFEILIEGDEGRLVIQHGARNSMGNMGGWAWEPYLHRWRGRTEPVEWEPVPHTTRQRHHKRGHRPGRLHRE